MILNTKKRVIYCSRCGDFIGYARVENDKEFHRKFGGELCSYCMSHEHNKEHVISYFER